MWYNRRYGREEDIRKDAVKAFAAGMSTASKRKYDHALEVIRQIGYLRYPEAEKFDEYENLFAIRIVTSGNERFFYCYDDGEMVVVLHSFAKRTKKTPRAELQKALRIRKELLGE